MEQKERSMDGWMSHGLLWFPSYGASFLSAANEWYREGQWAALLRSIGQHLLLCHACNLH